MKRDEILGFLEAVDAELSQHVRDGETVNLYLIGRSALILRFDLNLATRDVDIVHFHGSEPERIAVEHFGKGTANAERLGFYLEPVPQDCRRSPAATVIVRKTFRAPGESSGRNSRSPTTWP